MKELIGLMEGRICILNEYKKSLCQMLKHLEREDFDVLVLDEFNSKHDGFIERLKENGQNIDRQVGLMEPEKSGYLTRLLTGEEPGDCPAYAEDFASLCQRQRETVRDLIETNNRCVTLLQNAIKEARTELKKAGKSDAVFNYYSGLKGTQTGMVVDTRN